MPNVKILKINHQCSPKPLCLVSCYPVHMKENLKKLFKLYYSPSPKPSNELPVTLKLNLCFQPSNGQGPSRSDRVSVTLLIMGFQATQPCLYPALGLLCSPQAR